jgi:hypothetical protein
VATIRSVGRFNERQAGPAVVGVVSGDARVWHATFLLEYGEEQAGRALLETVFAEGPDDYVSYEAAAETFEGLEDLEQALRWFEAGLGRLRMLGDNSDEGFGRYRLAFGRRRIRESMGLAADDVDRQAERERQARVEQSVAARQERSLLVRVRAQVQEVLRPSALTPRQAFGALGRA